MRARLHAALVYFGLRKDQRLEAELNAAPLTLWRLAAVAVPLGLGLVLALGVLWLVGVRVTWQTPLSFLAVLGIASAAAGVAARLSRGSVD
jgi:hypothetical protein